MFIYCLVVFFLVGWVSLLLYFFKKKREERERILKIERKPQSGVETEAKKEECVSSKKEEHTFIDVYILAGLFAGWAGGVIAAVFTGGILLHLVAAFPVIFLSFLIFVFAMIYFLAFNERLFINLPRNKMVNVESQAGEFIKVLLNSSTYFLYEGWEALTEEEATKFGFSDGDKLREDWISHYFYTSWLMEKIGLKGVKWLGLNKLHQYEFQIEISEGNIDAVTKYPKGNITQYYYLQLVNYRREFEGLDSLGYDGRTSIPLSFILIANMSIRNAYKAGYLVENWVDFSFTKLLAYLRCYVANKQIDVLQKRSIPSADLDIPDPNFDLDLGLRPYLRKYGIDLEKLEFLDVRFSNPKDEERYKRSWDAEQEGKAKVVSAEYFKQEQALIAEGKKAVLDMIQKYPELQNLEAVDRLSAAIRESKNQQLSIFMGGGEGNLPLLSEVKRINNKVHQSSSDEPKEIKIIKKGGKNE